MASNWIKPSTQTTASIMPHDTIDQEALTQGIAQLAGLLRWDETQIQAFTQKLGSLMNQQVGNNFSLCSECLAGHTLT